MNQDYSIVEELFKVPQKIKSKLEFGPSFVVLPGPSSRSVASIRHPFAKDCVTVVSGGASAVLPLVGQSTLIPTIWFDNGDIGRGASKTEDYANFLEGALERYIVINTRTLRENAHMLIESEEFFINYLHRFIFYDFYYYSGYARNIYLRWQNRLLNILNFLVLCGSKHVFMFGSDGPINRANPEENYLPDRSGYRGGDISTLDHNMHSIERSIPALTNFWRDLGLNPELFNMSLNSTLRCFKKITLADLDAILELASHSHPLPRDSRSQIKPYTERKPDNNERHFHHLRMTILHQGPTLETLFYERDISLEQLVILHELLARIPRT
jgi:hypothetical protein